MVEDRRRGRIVGRSAVDRQLADLGALVGRRNRELRVWPAPPGHLPLERGDSAKRVEEDQCRAVWEFLLLALAPEAEQTEEVDWAGLQQPDFRRRPALFRGRKSSQRKTVAMPGITRQLRRSCPCRE